jgi:hypothetical protein
VEGEAVDRARRAGILLDDEAFVSRVRLRTARPSRAAHFERADKPSPAAPRREGMTTGGAIAVTIVGIVTPRNRRRPPALTVVARYAPAHTYATNAMKVTRRAAAS